MCVWGGAGGIRTLRAYARASATRARRALAPLSRSAQTRCTCSCAAPPGAEKSDAPPRPSALRVGECVWGGGRGGVGVAHAPSAADATAGRLLSSTHTPDAPHSTPTPPPHPPASAKSRWIAFLGRESGMASTHAYSSCSSSSVTSGSSAIEPCGRLGVRRSPAHSKSPRLTSSCRCTATNDLPRPRSTACDSRACAWRRAGGYGGRAARGAAGSRLENRASRRSTSCTGFSSAAAPWAPPLRLRCVCGGVHELADLRVRRVAPPPLVPWRPQPPPAPPPLRAAPPGCRGDAGAATPPPRCPGARSP